ncbi:aminoacyl--tRNA ligase-related protein [Streptomyces sp. NPDC047072]|uniref:aminoacyl--tRNA ligase-related protein n=1 Tax=Streptomyces sp. NPDC047072 TaxID=3154809 RepID=UPI0033F9432C
MSGRSRVDGGLALLGPQDTALLRLLDDTFRDWGVQAGAGEISAPPLYPVDALAHLDVYVNFPHLALVAGGLTTPTDGPAQGRFTTGQTADAHLGLSTATCFGAYLLLQDTRVAPDTLLTLVNRCFRKEDHFDGLRRLLSFQMREIVAIGTQAHTKAVIARFRERVEEFLTLLALDVRVEAATDPFFEAGGVRALLQKMEPVKYEFQVDGLAIASVNTHRNFFGERCRITVGDDGATAFTGCVAFGLERWLAVLLDHYGTAEKARTAVDQALRELGPG